jgi:hypothetical protein
VRSILKFRLRLEVIFRPQAWLVLANHSGLKLALRLAKLAVPFFKKQDLRFLTCGLKRFDDAIVQ